VIARKSESKADEMRKMDNVPVSGNVPGRWAMAVRGFLCQNIILGCSAGGFGVAMPFL